MSRFAPTASNVLWLCAALFLALILIVIRMTGGRKELSSNVLLVQKPRIESEAEVGRVEVAKSKGTEFRDPRLARANRLMRFKVEQLQAYLEKEGRSPKSLIAAYYLSRDEGLLEELKIHPNSPQACALLAIHAPTPKERLHFSKLMRQLNPDNGYGWFLEAKAALDCDEEQAAQEAFSAGVKTARFDSFPEHLVELRKAIQGVGYDFEEARILAHSSNEWRNDATSFLPEMVKTLYAAEASKLDDDGRLAAATRFLRLPQILNGLGANASLFSETSAVHTEVMILKSLPRDVEYGTSGMSVADRLAQIKNWMSQESILRKSELSGPILGSAEPALVNEYYSRLDLFGEKAALDWLLETHGTKK